MIEKSPVEAASVVVTAAQEVETSETEPSVTSKLSKKPSVRKSTAVTNGSTRSSRNTKVSSCPPKIMATGIVLSEKDKQIVTNLGGQVVTDVRECTHLVTNKIRKTYKFLSCVSKGASILNERWLQESNKSKMFQSA